jgi:hypothetical protein
MARTWLIGSCLTATIGLFILPLSIVPANQQVPAVKLIEYGWDAPRPEFVRTHIADMERRPFDGVIIRLPDGGGEVFQPKTWNPEKLSLQLPILRDIQWQSFDSNFLAMYAASSMDWYDDGDWRVVTEHAAFMGRAAYEAHCRGLMFDPEPYGPSPWNYSLQRHASVHAFADYEAVVRRRGREFMRALQHGYPGLELLTLQNYSFFLRAGASPDPNAREKVLTGHAWGLFPAFLNGMLEEADSDTRLIDGHEQSYFFERPEDFARGAAEVRQGAIQYVSSELTNKYVRQFQVAQPVYLDWIFGYFKPSSPTVIDGLSDDQRARLAEHHTYYAMKNADRYVWSYSEKMNWWTGEHLPPGAEDALRSARRKFSAGESLGFDVTSILERPAQGPDRPAQGLSR